MLKAMLNNKNFTTKLLLSVVVLLAILVIRQQWQRPVTPALTTLPTATDATTEAKQFVHDVNRIITFNDDNIDFNIAYRSNIIEISRNIFEHEATASLDDDAPLEETVGGVISGGDTRAPQEKAQLEAQANKLSVASALDNAITVEANRPTTPANANNANNVTSNASLTAGNTLSTSNNSPLPPPPFVFIGESSNADGSNQQLTLLHNTSQEQITAQLGDTIYNRWRVTRLGQGYLELEDLTTKARQRLNIGEYPENLAKSAATKDKKSRGVKTAPTNATEGEDGEDNPNVTNELSTNLPANNAKAATASKLGANSAAITNSKPPTGSDGTNLNTAVFQRAAQPPTYAELVQKRAKARQEQQKARAKNQ